MDALTLILVIVALLIGLDVMAMSSGADSRDCIGDDHAR